MCIRDSFQTVPALSFTTVAGGANPLPQVVAIASTGTQFTFSATPSTSTGGSWLTVTPSGGGCCNTPEGVTVSANAASLTAGTYTGQILFANYPSATVTMAVPDVYKRQSGSRSRMRASSTPRSNNVTTRRLSEGPAV